MSTLAQLAASRVLDVYSLPTDALAQIQAQTVAYMIFEISALRPLVGEEFISVEPTYYLTRSLEKVQHIVQQLQATNTFTYRRYDYVKYFLDLAHIRDLPGAYVLCIHVNCPIVTNDIAEVQRLIAVYGSRLHGLNTARQPELRPEHFFVPWEQIPADWPVVQ